MKEIPTAYNPKETEDKIYKLWEDSGAFTPEIKEGVKPFVIDIPPPNVTGSLHMGHALNNTIIDTLIRRSRMRGVPTLYLPGTDHAGIATQSVVEKKLEKEGKSRHELGRDQFIEEVWKWKKEYGHIIIDQLKKLGCSCDWTRERFTMDEDYSDAVNTAFKHYYDKGWIYQGERVINWCVKHQTSLSDIEVEYKEQTAKLYYFKYDKNFPISIATTRPETKLGDTAVAVNQSDSRYKDYIGKVFEVDFAGVKRKIKIIADPKIDPKFGTGAVGVTPAHSLADAEMAEKNDLKVIQVIDKFGKMTKEAGAQFEGLKVAEAREKILEWLKKEDLLEKKEEITNNLSVCYRCGREIEPQPSKQWFLKMSELIKPAIEAIKNDEIKISPVRWKKVYLDWMENIRDWCISRQIWWGHKIPIDGVDDVLDTWFSSALWPFATLGWPVCHPEHSEGSPANAGLAHEVPDSSQAQNDISDLDYFYPTTILSTARDINMLWVVRMIFSGYEFMKEKPFSEVYVHPTVFNIDGKRMSKSLGTGVDPLELIEKYGTDAVRFGLSYINTGTQDIKFDENAILAGKKFTNKIWNIARFILMQTDGNGGPKDDGKCPVPKSEADKKILESLNHLIASYNRSLDDFKFGQAAHDLYDFVWHDLADIYIEKSKTQMENLEYRVNTTEILLYVLTISLKLLHPTMPFVTEEIWQELYREKLVEEKLLITAKWPER